MAVGGGCGRSIHIIGLYHGSDSACAHFTACYHYTAGHRHPADTHAPA